jgi:hypothetical protein
MYQIWDIRFAATSAASSPRQLIRIRSPLLERMDRNQTAEDFFQVHQDWFARNASDCEDTTTT